MIYQDLLDFLASNYLSQEKAFDLLNGAVLSLAGQNVTHFSWMVGVLGVGIGVLVAIALFIINRSYKKDKKALKQMEEDLKMRMGKMRKNLKNTISKSEESMHVSLFDFSKQSDLEIKEFRKDADRLFKAQQVRIKWYFWNSFFFNRGNTDYFMLLLSLSHYIDAEYWYFHEFSKFVCAKEFAELESHYNFVFKTLKEKNFPYSESNHALVEKKLGGFKSYPQFLEFIERILEKSKSMITNPSLNLPPQKSKT